jgi:hypothetical protein
MRRRLSAVIPVSLVILLIVATGSAGASGSTPRQRIEAFWAARHRELVARGLAPHTALPRPASAPSQPASFQRLRGVQQVSKQTIPPLPGSEPDTQIEPDIAMDVNNSLHVTAVFQQGRYADGGSVDPGYATSQDGGKTWTRGDFPGLTVAVGGPYDRASDPAVAFGPNGEVYATTLPFDVTCDNGVAVSRSDDGGLTFNDPVFAQQDDCSAFDDKNWIAVDTFPSSPYVGRVYLSWERGSCGQPIVLRYSDDQGATWSPLETVSGACTSGIGVIPLVQPNGDLTLVYESFDSGDNMVAQTSHNGGVTFDPKVTINSFRGTEPPDQRTGGLVTATIDHVTGTMYAGWQDARFRSDGTNDIVLSSSTNGGATWSPLTVVNQDPETDGLDHLTPDVAAHNGFVHVTYLTRQKTGGIYTNMVDIRYIHSEDSGVTWAGELVLGPPSNLRWAAQAGGYFLGDYMGVAASGTAVHAVWCRSSKPPTPETYHQTAWSATVLK